MCVGVKKLQFFNLSILEDFYYLREHKHFGKNVQEVLGNFKEADRE